MAPKVKICGLTNYEDALAALALGADILGFVFAPSPRRVEPEAAAKIVKRLRDADLLGAAETVGVFVNESPAAMAATLELTSISTAQIHGDEAPELCSTFAFPWYRALRVGPKDELKRLVEGPPAWACERLLFDASSTSAYGGTGRTIERSLALEARALTRRQGKRFFIAGGIRPENVASVLRSLQPDGIDVSSGVEERPGKKSRSALELLFREIEAADAVEGV